VISMSEFNMKKWFSGVRRLADEFYNCRNKNFVSYNSKVMDRIEECYPVRLSMLKKEIFPVGDLAGSKIDRYKLIALYTQLFLEAPVFEIPRAVISGDRSLMGVIFANEIFCQRVIINTLEDGTGKTFEAGKFKKEYMTSFLRLLYRYREQSEFYKKNVFFTCALAHALYFFERDFFVENTGRTAA